MAEADAVDRLISFNFMSFQDEVEQILAWKARNTDPRAQPDYFKILYAWYIVRGDYRSGRVILSEVYPPADANPFTAGGAVYQQGRRLALMQGQSNDDPKLLATSQAGCYLAAINALSLVDSKNAWVEMSLTPGEAARVGVTFVFALSQSSSESSLEYETPPCHPPFARQPDHRKSRYRNRGHCRNASRIPPRSLPIRTYEHVP
jgi:hypothetical protein